MLSSVGYKGFGKINWRKGNQEANLVVQICKNEGQYKNMMMETKGKDWA